MYYAKGNEVWVKSGFGDEELFLTVNTTEPIKSGIMTIETQTKIIAEILNEACK